MEQTNEKQTEEKAPYEVTTKEELMNNNEEIEVEDIPTFEPEQQGTDLSEFEGNKVKVDSISVIDNVSSYDETGHYKEGLQRPVKKLKVLTTTVTQLVKSDGTNININASELFGMAYKDGKWGISSHPKAGIQKFMKRQKVTKLKDLIGTTVTVKAVENKEGKVFLGFITE